MRWLTLTVAGSSCCWAMVLAGLLAMPSPVAAPTIGLETRGESHATDSNRADALVDVVTDRNGPLIDLGAPAALVYVITDQSGPVIDLGVSDAQRSIALVEIVTDHDQSSANDSLIDESMASTPAPNDVAESSTSTNRTVGLVEVITDSSDAEKAAASIGDQPTRHGSAQVTVVTEPTPAGPRVELSRAQNKVSVAQVRVVTQADETTPPLPPSEFNPDPGASAGRVEEEAMPPELFPPILPQPPEYGEEALPRSLQLPRKGVREVEPRRRKLEYENYPDSEAGEGLLPSSEPVPNRWFIGFGRWKRYADPSTETTYQSGLKLWHPYLQSELKGDSPILGTEDIFLNITLENFFQTEFRKLPTGSGVSAENPNSSEFFGRGDQFFLSNDFSLGIDLFKGETAFKPVEWLLRFLVVENHNYIDVEERNVVNPNPQNGTTRDKNFVSLQEAFAEIHIRDLSNNYDFVSSRWGIQPFVSDFRGFIFNDTNNGVRIFGNYDNNRWQYNVAVFDMLEKDTYSGLNEFSRREQQIYTANVFRQDLIWKGYTGELTFLADFDNNSRHYDKNGFITRPAPIGTVADHYVQAYYLGWTGDGHIGWLNIDHAFYQVFGEDSLNGIAGRRVDINAQMAALELSVDKNWLRHKLSFFYASGDSNPTDSHATGFDTVLDRPFFIGGPFSYYSHQGFNLAGTAVNFKQPDSLVVDFRTSKIEGQANFVNPGVFIVGYGLDADVLPKMKLFVNANYIRTCTTAPTELVLMTNHSSNDFAMDFSAGIEYRPFLTENVIITAGAGFLVPRWGYKEIYRNNTVPVHGFPQGAAGQTDDFLYSAILTVTLTY